MKSPALKAIEEGQILRLIVNQKRVTPSRFQKPPTPERIDVILNIVAKEYCVTIEQLKSRNRRQHIAWPRQICYYLLRLHTNLSFQGVAEALGKDDHNSAFSGAKVAADRISVYPDVRRSVDDLSAAINRLEGDKPKD